MQSVHHPCRPLPACILLHLFWFHQNIIGEASIDIINPLYQRALHCTVITTFSMNFNGSLPISHKVSNIHVATHVWHECGAWWPSPSRGSEDQTGSRALSWSWCRLFDELVGSSKTLQTISHAHSGFTPPGTAPSEAPRVHISCLLCSTWVNVLIYFPPLTLELLFIYLVTLFTFQIN